jgi:hypothetical protein
MQKVSNSADVHRFLVDEAKYSWTLGLLAFAIIEDQKFDWIAHFRENFGRDPDESEIIYWYEQQPESEFTRAIADAEHALQLVADDALKDILDRERLEVERGVVVTEIRLSRRFLPQFGINVAAGIISSLLFAAILVLIALFVFLDPSPIGWVRNPPSK